MDNKKAITPNRGFKILQTFLQNLKTSILSSKKDLEIAISKS